MLRARGNNHQISSLDILIFARDGCFSYSGGEGQGLVDCVDLSKVSLCVEVALQEAEC